jgi:peptide/nickel transport system permease protein
MSRRRVKSSAQAMGAALLTIVVFAGCAAPWVAPHSPHDQFPHLLNAPPTSIHIIDADGRVHAPFIYSWRRVNQLEQRYEIDRSVRIPVVWFGNGRLAQSADEDRAPLLPLGADSFGRDVFARLLFAARTSLGLSLAAACGAVWLGAIVGGVAGYAGGTVDEMLMRGSEFILVLPAMYVVLALRAALPLVLEPGEVFLLLLGILSVIGAPWIARGVRGIVRSERRVDYAVAAVSLGASHWRLLRCHLLPATRGFLAVQLTLLVPSFILAEATLSYIGLGFPAPVVSWGTMLQEASSLRALADFPWLLSPAAAMFVVVIGLNLVLQQRTPYQLPK